MQYRNGETACLQLVLSLLCGVIALLGQDFPEYHRCISNSGPLYIRSPGAREPNNMPGSGGLHGALEPDLRKDLLFLQAQRDALEMEAAAIASELKSPGANGEAPVGVKGSLVDSDGFPLAGFNLFHVREKRHR